MALHTDEELMNETSKAAPQVVSVDAPLCLPKGRVSLEHKGPPHFRACDLKLREMKIRFFPITLGPMRLLTARGIRLKQLLESKGFEVIESYPGAAQDLLGMPRKQEGKEKLRASLVEFGIRGDVNKKEITHDELDAVTSALVGLMYLRGSYISIGDPEEGLMILPSKDRRIPNSQNDSSL
jgi:predicted nuclease with RNAse H fold